MSNYPPGVTGNEPQITGEWPCLECDGEGGDREERVACGRCKGSGIEPEEFDVGYLEQLVEDRPQGDRLTATLETLRCSTFDRRVEADRRILRAAAALRRQERGL